MGGRLHRLGSGIRTQDGMLGRWGIAIEQRHSKTAATPYEIFSIQNYLPKWSKLFHKAFYMMDTMNFTK